MFSPFLGPVLSELLQLLEQTEIVESKLRVAASMEAVLQNAGAQVCNMLVLCELRSLAFSLFHSSLTLHLRYHNSVRSPSYPCLKITGLNYQRDRDRRQLYGQECSAQDRHRACLSTSVHSSFVQRLISRVQAVKENSSSLSSIVVPLIQESFSPSVSPSLYLRTPRIFTHLSI